jgi:polysaccharide export outer membrane protein
MLQKHIRAAGLYPEDLEKSIRTALIDDQVLVDPIVTVSVIEYSSRPINIIGEVKNPMTIQAVGSVTLLEALLRAGGLTERAGPEILVTHQPGNDVNSSALVRRIPVRDLFDSVDSSLNLNLEGGEVIRVPEAGRFWVVGNVKNPGSFEITAGSEITILKALALTKGLEPYSKGLGFIYRTESGSGGKNEIPVELKKIMDRKSPDVALQANDILYVPEATGRKTSVSIARGVVTLGLAVTGTLLFIYH